MNQDRVAGRWKKLAGRVSVAVVLLLAAVQVFHARRTNPPEEESHRIGALTRMTPAVARVIDRSCRDCHSNTTRWPWYSAVAPMSWMVVSHVNQGRRHINFSDWSRYGATESAEHLESVCRFVERGDMPLTSYTRIHTDAKLTREDVSTLCEWARAEAGRLRAAPATAAGHEGGSD